LVELISVHVPKTAGTTFQGILNQVYGEENIYYDYRQPRPIKNDPSEITPQIKVIHGHFSIKEYDVFFPEAKQIIWLRNPIHMVISLYFYWLYVPLGNLYNYQEIVRNVKNFKIELDEFVEQPDARNLICQYIIGTNIEDFDFVGLQEFFHADLAELQTMLQWSGFRILDQNYNPNPKYQESLENIFSNKELLEKLIKNNQEDIEVYQEALNLRAKRRKESKFIQPIMAEWNRSQQRLTQVLKDAQQTQVELVKAQSEFWQIKAELFLAKGQLDDALGACEQALKIQPEFAQAYLTMGNVLQIKGLLDEAKNWYDRAVAIQPNFVEALDNLGNVCMQQQQWSEAIAAYEKVLAVQPNLAGVYRNLASAFSQLNKLEEATDCMYIVLILEAEKSTALDYLNLGNTLLSQNRVERAIICYRRAIYLDPSFSEAHRLLRELMT
jgi:tetratricopeptide (TPR) repeat protein